MKTKTKNKPTTTLVKDSDGDRVVDAIGETVMQYSTTPMRVGASMPVHYVRQAFVTGGKKAALSAGHEVLTGVSDERILAIAQEKATLRGYSDTGITYHDAPCVACLGTGRIHTSPGGPGARCETCCGDGFSPAMPSEDRK